MKMIAALLLLAIAPASAVADDLAGAVGIDSRAEPDGADAAVRAGGEAGVAVSGGIYELATGADVAVGLGALGLLRGSHWASMRYDASLAQAAEAARTGAASGRQPKHDPIDSWVIYRHRLDLEARAPLGRRRDLARARYTGARLGLEAVLLGDADPLGGGALLPLTYDVDLVRDGGVRHTFHASAFRWWTRGRLEQPEHAREVLTVDSQVHDLEFASLADTIIAWAERGHPLGGDLYLDYRAGFATNTGTTSIGDQMFVEQRHPHVTAGVVDGGVRLVRGPATAGLRYDRSLYLTFDSMLALEDRATASAVIDRGRLAIGGEAFAARTLVWSERDTDEARALTGGAATHWRAALHGIELSGVVEVARSFYARLDGAVAEPAWGWRAELQLMRSFGGAEPGPAQK